MARVSKQKVVTGYVVKRETVIEKPDPKRAGQTIRGKCRVEVGRVYHSVDAAKTLMNLLKKQYPDWDLYIHEKRRDAEMA